MPFWIKISWNCEVISPSERVLEEISTNGTLISIMGILKFLWRVRSSSLHFALPMAKTIVSTLSFLVLILGILSFVSCFYATNRVNKEENDGRNFAQIFITQSGFYTAVIMIESFFSIISLVFAFLISTICFLFQHHLVTHIFTFSS